MATDWHYVIKLTNVHLRDELCREDIQRRVKKMREEHSYLKDDLASWMLKLHTAREEKFVAVNKMTELNRKKADRQKLGEEILQIDMDIEVGCLQVVIKAMCILFHILMFLF